MKKVVSLVFSACVVVLFADEIDDIVAKINTKRDSKISKEEFVSISSPMVKSIVESSEINSSASSVKKIDIKDKLHLEAIINDSAFVNGHWVKIGEKIDKFKLIDVTAKSIYLKDGNRSKSIFLKQENSKIKITIGG